MLAKSNFGKSLIPWLFIGLATSTSNVAAATPVKNLLCFYPIGASTYLPGGRVPASAGGTVEDAYTGVLRLSLRV